MMKKMTTTTTMKTLNLAQKRVTKMMSKLFRNGELASRSISLYNDYEN